MKKKLWVTVLVILVIYLGLRLPGFGEKMTFHMDQGIHLGESFQMVAEKKLRLIGPMITSKTYLDRGFFLGPQYYYLLATLGLIFAWSPLSITLFLAFIEMIIFGYFSWWIGKKFGVIEGIFVAILLTISPYLIINSRFTWNPHLALLLGLIATMWGVKISEKNQKRDWFILGLIWGTAFGLHFTTGIWIIPIGILLIKKLKTWKWWWLIPGGVIGNLPWFLFELRHNFYNTRTFFWVMGHAESGEKLEPHYVINPFLGIILLALVWGLVKIKNTKIKYGVMGILIIASYLGQNLIYKNEKIPLGHPKGWTYPIQLEVVDMILKNGCPKDYNIAETISGSTRGYDLRYLLTVKKCPPMAVEKYSEAKTLYLLAPPNRPPETEMVWEVKSFGKFKVKEKIKLNENVIFYELGF